MSFGIRAALDALVTLQQGVAITDPISESVKKAWKTIPRQDGALATLPAIINLPKPIRISHVAGARAQIWQVRSQLFVYDANQDRSGDIVLALMEKYIDALSDAQTLNGQPLILGDHFGSECPTQLVYAGKPFIGAELTITLQVPLEAVTVGT